jgi:hypothetical protein
MLDRTIVLWTIAACMLATAIAAQPAAPTTTAFDGSYAGVSRTVEGNTDRSLTGGYSRQCGQSGRAAPLTIVNGVARTAWAGTAEGSVNPQGVLVMRAPNGDKFDGQIDGHGAVTGRFTGNCAFQMVWQKPPPPTMPFDGDYTGVSRELTNGGAGCSPSGVPGGTLIIRNSVALGQWQGTVSPQGIVSLRTPNGTPVDGQIDRQGMMRVQGTSAAGCTNIWVWRKPAG